MHFYSPALELCIGIRTLAFGKVIDPQQLRIFFELAVIAIVGQADVALESVQGCWFQSWRNWWGIGWACVGGLRQNCEHQYKELPNSVRKTCHVSRALFHRAKFRHPQTVYRLFEMRYSWAYPSEELHDWYLL